MTASIAEAFAAQCGISAERVSVRVTPASVQIAILISAPDGQATDDLANALEPITQTAAAASSFLSTAAGFPVSATAAPSIVASQGDQGVAPSSGGLDGGTIAGIAAAALVGTLILGACLYKAWRNIMDSPAGSQLNSESDHSPLRSPRQDGIQMYPNVKKTAL